MQKEKTKTTTIIIITIKKARCLTSSWLHFDEVCSEVGKMDNSSSSSLSPMSQLNKFLQYSSQFQSTSSIKLWIIIGRL